MVGLDGLRHQHANVLADHFLGTVAPEFFRGRVEAGDNIVRIDCHHGVHSLFEGLQDLLATTDLFGDVLDEGGITDRVIHFDFRQREFAPAHLTVLAVDLDFAGGADNFINTGTAVGVHKIVVIGLNRLWHQHANVLADHFLGHCSPRVLPRPG